MLRVSAIALAAQSAYGFTVGAAPAMHVQSTRMSSPSMASLYDFSANSLTGGKEKKFADYKGKPVLILNVASL